MPSSLAKRLRSVALCGLPLFCLIALPPRAFADTLYAFPSDGNHRLGFADCDDGDECFNYELVCSESGLSLTVLGAGDERDTRAIAAAMMSAPWGEARLRFRIAGTTEVAIPVGSFSVDLDEMNADWDVTLRSFDESGFYAALNKKTARSAEVEIDGKFLPLAPRAGDDAKLLAFKKACAR